MREGEKAEEEERGLEGEKREWGRREERRGRSQGGLRATTKPRPFPAGEMVWN